MYYLIICIHINMAHKWQQGFKPLTTSLSPINCGTQHGAEPAMTQTARDRWCINEVHAGAAIATAQAVVGSCFKTTCLWANYWLVVWNMNFIFPYIGIFHPIWLSYFSEGLKPPTKLWLGKFHCESPPFINLWCSIWKANETKSTKPWLWD